MRLNRRGFLVGGLLAALTVAAPVTASQTRIARRTRDWSYSHTITIELVSPWYIPNLDELKRELMVELGKKSVIESITGTSIVETAGTCRSRFRIVGRELERGYSDRVIMAWLCKRDNIATSITWDWT